MIFIIGECGIVMSRVIDPGGPGKERSILTKFLVVACREYCLQTKFSKDTLDLAAFIMMSLESIAQTVIRTATAWENRGYWVKADKFQAEWNWVALNAKLLHHALLVEDWMDVTKIIKVIQEKLLSVSVPYKYKGLHPWTGSWEIYLKIKSSQRE